MSLSKGEMEKPRDFPKSRFFCKNLLRITFVGILG